MRTLLWFTVGVVVLSVRTDNLGVTSIVRALGLDGKYYDNLLDSFHSTGVKLDALSATWAKVVLRERKVKERKDGVSSRIVASSPHNSPYGRQVNAEMLRDLPITIGAGSVCRHDSGIPIPM